MFETAKAFIAVTAFIVIAGILATGDLNGTTLLATVAAFATLAWATR